MAVTQIGAIYATGSKLLQRVYVPSVNDSEIDAQHIGAGETLTHVPLATYQAGGSVAVQAALGAPSISGRCAVVDNTNMVVDHIIADLAVFGATDPQGRLLVASDRSAVGDAWNGTNFMRRYVEINPHAPTALSSIVAVSIQNIDTAAPATAGNILMASGTLNAGSVIAPSLFLKLKALP
jgi:hypothetical protein